MLETQRLRNEVISVLDGLPLEGLRLLAEFVEFLRGKFKLKKLALLVEAMTDTDSLLTPEAKLERGRARLLQLGEGLGEGNSPHDVARNHDQYLYSRNVI